MQWTYIHVCTIDIGGQLSSVIICPSVIALSCGMLYIYIYIGYVSMVVCDFDFILNVKLFEKCWNCWKIITNKNVEILWKMLIFFFKCWHFKKKMIFKIFQKVGNGKNKIVVHVNIFGIIKKSLYMSLVR